VATVTVVVTPVADPPVALADSYPRVSATTTLNVLANDKSPDGKALTIANNGLGGCQVFPSTGLVLSSGDKVTLNSARTRFTFTPVNVPRGVNRARNASFNYCATDGTLNSSSVAVAVKIYK